MKTIWVRCYRGKALLRSYEFGVAEPMDPRKVAPPNQKDLIDQAKSSLTTERIAFPSYEGIEFKVEYPR